MMRLAPVMAAALSIGAAHAAPVTGVLTTAQVSAALEGATVRSVRPAPSMPGWFEVVTSDDAVLYVDRSLEHAIQGPLVELRTRRNLSDEGLQRGHTVDFATIPLDASLRRVRGDGSRHLAILADPDCPYCAQLELALGKVDNVTLYVLPFPLTELHPEAEARAQSIWCSTDAARAWERWLLEHEAPVVDATRVGCAAPLAEVRRFAERVGAQGTPMLIFGSGRVAFGALRAETLEAYLDESAADVRDDD